MKSMTWKEFKEYVDKRLEEQGISQSSVIEYIDVSHPCENHPMCKPEVCFGFGEIQIY